MVPVHPSFGLTGNALSRFWMWRSFRMCSMILLREKCGRSRARECAHASPSAAKMPLPSLLFVSTTGTLELVLHMNTHRGLILRLASPVSNSPNCVARSACIFFGSLVTRKGSKKMLPRIVCMSRPSSWLVRSKKLVKQSRSLPLLSARQASTISRMPKGPRTRNCGAGLHPNCRARRGLRTVRR